MTIEAHTLDALNAEQTHLLFNMCFIGLMFVFFISTALMEFYKPKIGHATGITVLLGLLISLMFWLSFGTKNVE